MSNPLRQIEWRSLIEVAGPFLADAVLEKAFPQGLEKLETPRKQRVRSAYDEWCEAVEDSDPQLAELHDEWLRLVLEDLLEYDATVLKAKPEFPETFRYQHPQTESPVLPDMVVMAGDKPRLLITTLPPGTKLESPLADQSWPASPLERMTLLCRATEVSLGLVTNGEQWTLVSASVGETSSTASWFARIWQQEPVTLQAFQSLLGVRRMFGPANETLEALLLESLQHLDEVTDTLGSQVRRAVEVLVQALDRADLDRDRQLLKEVSPSQLYEAGLTVMMRLVFTLCAEERKLLLLGEPIYDQHYAISTLRARLNEDREQLGEDVLERRHDAWSRLLAVFRAIYGGIEHETLRMPPLGGSIFDPDRYPFLEGRAIGTHWVDTPASPLPIDNRTVLLLLNALQVLEQRTGARLLSYLALDVEQIGHVYEGLLERTVKKVPETTLGLIGSQKAVNPNVLLRDLEEAKTAGEDRLLSHVLEKTERSEAGVRNSLVKPLDEALYHRVLLACGGDITLANRIRPFAALLRSDNWGDPLVYRANSYMVTLGAGRRETGTHYTPKSLTEPIVQHTLEPLCYVGPTEGNPRAEWRLKTAAQLLALKICDMAMGSGAFLVQVCRWLADRLVEAWEAEEKAGGAISIEGVVLDEAGDAELLPRDSAERVLIARRLVASRCLYGVDINPMAVELAKLSLWLVTMMKNRPFSFLDHALKCGDSLLGVCQLKQLEHFSLRDADHAQPLLETANLWRHIEEAAELRRELEVMPSHTPAQIAAKARLHAQAESQLAKLRAAANFLVAAELDCPDGRGWDTRRALAASQMQAAWKKHISEFQSLARAELSGRRPFHWPLEFPEVFARGGFDAFVSNPPFIGNKYWLERLPNGFSQWVQVLLGQKAGKADVVAVFFRRAHSLLAASGIAGMIATATAREGDTLELGFVQISKSGTIFRALSALEWPGKAGVHVCVVWFSKEPSNFVPNLDGKTVGGIGPSLTEATTHEEVYELASAPWGFIGCDNGGGEVLTLKSGDSWLKRLEAVSSPFLRAYLTGDDIAAGRHRQPERWVVDCGDMSLSAVESACRVTGDFLRSFVKPARSPEDFATHPGLIDRWWQMWNPRATQYRKLRRHQSCLAIPVVAKFVSVVELPTAFAFTNKVCVLEKPPAEQHIVLLSSFFEAWVIKHGGTMGATRITVALKKCIQTFPFPTADIPNARDLISEWNQALVGCAAQYGHGYTPIFNAFHSEDSDSGRIDVLRAVRRKVDQAVAVAYGHVNLASNEGAALRHGFHETKQGVRWTLHSDVRRDVLDHLIVLNHQRHAEEVAAGQHHKKSGKKGPAAARPQEPEFALEPAKPAPAPVRAKAKDNGSEPGRSSSDVEQTDLLNAIFTCAGRREVTDREDLARQVAETLGFQRLTSNLREVIASGINSAIRRGLVTYEAQNIHRVAASYAELDHEFLVKAINASIRPGCVYTPEKVLHLAADYLGCKRLKDAFSDRLESALTAASRRGLLIKRGEEIRKAY